ALHETGTAGQRGSEAGTSTQPLTPHAWQIPSQAVLQQAPPVQMPSAHEVASVQLPPDGESPRPRGCTRPAGFPVEESATFQVTRAWPWAIDRVAAGGVTRITPWTPAPFAFGWLVGIVVARIIGALASANGVPMGASLASVRSPWTPVGLVSTQVKRRVPG